LLRDDAVRFWGDRTVNWVALTAVMVIVGAGVAGMVWLHRVNRARQMEVLRADIAAAEEGRGDKRLDQLLKRVLWIAPRDPEALDKYASLLAAKATTKREKCQAIAVLERAVRENPGKVALRRTLVDLSLAPGIGDICNPEPHLEFLQAAFPESAVYCARLAARAVAQGDLGRAEMLLKQGMERDRKDLATRLQLASLCRTRLGREKYAAELIAEVDANALKASDRLALAEYWRDAGDVTKRDATIAAAAAAFPNNLDVMLALAASLGERADAETGAASEALLSRARDLLKKGSERAPFRDEFFVRLAGLEATHGRRASAFTVVDNGLAANPDSAQLRWVKCELLMDVGGEAALQKVDALAEEIRSLAPGHDYLRLLELRLKFARRRWIEAAQGLEQSMPLLAHNRPLYRQGLRLLADAYRELGEPVMQEAACRRLLAMDPLNVDACTGLAEALTAQRRFTDVVSQLGQLYPRLRPANPLRLTAMLARAMTSLEAAKRPEQRQWRTADRMIEDAAKFNQRAADRLRVERLAADDRVEEALTFIRRVLVDFPVDQARKQLDADRAELHRTIVMLLLRKGDAVKAWLTLDQARTELGDCVPLRLAEAAILGTDRSTTHGPAFDRLAAGAEAFDEADRVTLWRELASIRQGLGDSSAALELYGRALGIKPLDQTLQRARFLAAFDAGDLKQADEAATAMAVVNASSGSPSTCARALLDLRDYEAAPDASRLHNQQVNLVGYDKYYTSWSGVPLALARVAELDGNARDALNHYNASVDRNTPSQWVARRLLLLNHQMGEDVAAQRWLATIGPESADRPTLMAAAEVALNTGNPVLAGAFVGRAAPADKADVDVSLWAAALLQAADSPAAAEVMLRRAVVAAPSQARGVVALIEFLVGRHRTEEAKKVVEAAAGRMSRSMTLLTKARLEEIVGNLTAARALVDAAAKDSPNDCAALRSVIEFRLRDQDFLNLRSAAAQLRQARDASASDKSWALRIESYALAADGQADAAQRVLEQAFPGSASVKRDDKFDIRARAIASAHQPNVRGRREALQELARLEVVGLAEPSDQLFSAQLEVSLDRRADARRRLMPLADRFGNVAALSFLVREMLNNDDPEKEIDVRLKRLEAVASNQPDVIHMRAQLLNRSNPAAAVDHLSRQVSRGAIDDLAAGRMLDDIGNLSGAAAFLKKAAGDRAGSLTPRQRSAAILLARILAQDGNAEEASSQCRILQDELTTSQYAQLVLEVLSAAKDGTSQRMTEEFADWLNRQIAKSPKDASLRLAVAGLEFQRGRYARAIELLTLLKSETPPNDPVFPAIINNCAYAMALGENMPEAAAGLLAQHLATSPTDFALRDTLAVVYLQQGKTNEAIAELQELAAMAPTGPVYFHLARAHAKKGDLAASRSALKRAFRLRFRPQELPAVERPMYEAVRAALKL